MKVDFITCWNKALWADFGADATSTWQHQPYHYEEGKGSRHIEWQRWRDSNSQVMIDHFDHWWDKFSHKPQAIIEHIMDKMQSDVTHVVWMDCDVVQLEDYDEEWLNDRLPHGNDLFTYLDRGGKNSENGWIAFNVKHPWCKTFMCHWEHMYFSNEVFKLKAWHDIGTFQAVYQMMKSETSYTAKTLRTSPGNDQWQVSEAFQRSKLAGKFAHLKGPRKVYIKRLANKTIDLKFAMLDIYKQNSSETFPWTENDKKRSSTI